MSRSARVTLGAISKELNLSTSSVSRALRNDPLIHPETRARVNTVAIRLGYQGRSRRGVRMTSPNTVQVLFAANSLADIQTGVITMSYLQGMTSEASAANVVVDVKALPSEAGDDSVTDQVVSSNEGQVLILNGRHDPSRVARLAKKYPLVSLVRNYDNVQHDLVSTDDFNGVRLLVNKLLALKHRKLAWVGFEPTGSYMHARRAGFWDACVSAGIAVEKQNVIEDCFDEKNYGVFSNPEPIFKAVERGVTAFVSGSDHICFCVCELLASRKIAVPQRISVTGFDGIGEPGRVVSPTFATIDPRFVEMGRAAFRLALWRRENPSAAPVQTTVRGKFISGNSIGPAYLKTARNGAAR